MTGRAWYAVTIAAVTALVLFAVTAIYVAHVQRDTEHKFCALLTAISAGPPPRTDRGRQIIASERRLARSLGCTGVGDG